MNGKLVILLLVFCVLETVSCLRHIVMHDGQYSPPNIALLIKDGRQVKIDSIDAKTSDSLIFFDNPVIELSPGPHSVQTHYYQSSVGSATYSTQTSLPVVVSFTAQPGCLYQLKLKLINNVYQPEIIDITEAVRDGLFADTLTLTYYNTQALRDLLSDISGTEHAPQFLKWKKRREATAD